MTQINLVMKVKRGKKRDQGKSGEEMVGKI